MKLGYFLDGLLMRSYLLIRPVDGPTAYYLAGWARGWAKDVQVNLSSENHRRRNNVDMNLEKEDTRQVIEFLSQFPRDSVPAPGDPILRGNQSRGKSWMTAETSDVLLVIDSSGDRINKSTDSIASADAAAPRGKKRGRKSKKSNIPGAKSLSKISANRMDYEDDILDKPDFLQIKKRDYQADKRRKVQECFLDDALSYRQKTAVDEVTYLFSQMSPKIVMTEILRVLDAASNVQRKTTSMKGDLRRQIIINVKVTRQAVQHGGELDEGSDAC
ncbi:hypothetical protein G5I_11642 [Acromyrmex echinatior]|uniref:Uncharacterized protein n=1 Tax=Acromyrmex echinatior TaxID=103372 RepID=F4X055_ACREC|nr:hypothetical protein G5I_11642 [Acromyrmex echinatior]